MIAGALGISGRGSATMRFYAHIVSVPVISFTALTSAFTESFRGALGVATSAGFLAFPVVGADNVFLVTRAVDA